MSLFNQYVWTEFPNQPIYIINTCYLTSYYTIFIHSKAERFISKTKAFIKGQLNSFTQPKTLQM